jgi:hypothetical protein
VNIGPELIDDDRYGVVKAPNDLYSIDTLREETHGPDDLLAPNCI